MTSKLVQLVIFGATGDLCRRKLVPALYELWKKKLLPKTLQVTGTSRKPRTPQDWRDSLGDYPEDFLKLFTYTASDLSRVETLNFLPEHDDNTYFLSVPPDRYEDAIINLKKSGRLDDFDNSRVVIEKPFGQDFKSASHLQSVVEKNLREKQVYRIDHYLGKDTVNNILATRFGNVLIEPLWNRDYIDSVQIFATETIGCEGRAQYYDTAGVVRDMLQNHMLQVLSLIAMDAPCRMDAKEIRREKTKVLAATRLGDQFITGQYDTYRDEQGVGRESMTQTFVAGDMYIDNWRWKDVPFYYMTGKKMPYQCVEVVVKLKAPPLGLFEEQTPGRIVMRLQPHAHLDVQIDVKSPGLGESVELATLTHRYPDWLGVDGYEKLLYDAMNKDQSHFVHSEEVTESWRIVDDLLCTGSHCPVRTDPYLYGDGEWGPRYKVDFITDWDYPA